MSMEYFAKYFYSDSLRLWDQFFVWFVGEQHAFGVGSTEIEQAIPYTQSRIPMLFHSIFGGLAILIAIYQFYKSYRIRYPQRHRVLGRLQVIVVTITVIGSIIYLINTSAEDTFSGISFHYLLWLLAIGTLLSLYLAVWAIIRKDILTHQVLMIFNFGALLSAPVLRLEWLIIGQIPNMTQELSNLYSALIFGYLLTPMAIIASRLTDPRKQTLSSPPSNLNHYSSFLNLGLIFCCLLYIFITYLYFDLFKIFDAFFYIIMCLTVMTFIGYVMMLYFSKYQKRWVAYREWRIHLVSFVVLPIFLLINWYFFTFFYTAQTAFQIAAMTTPPAIFGLGYVYMGYTRKRVI
ncbi:DUF2306 domain-containing protein [Acinetobacter haemolyticus]|uniref:DUF2306 domain-containing protein n=1 Tax=Acinetobacter haemolyticus TaxID=29430 RepID=UPI003F576A45